MKPGQVPRPRHLDHLLDDARGYPVIATVDRDKDHASFGSINEFRKLALAAFDWCAVCGLPCREASRWQAFWGGDLSLTDDELENGPFFNEAPEETYILYFRQVGLVDKFSYSHPDELADRYSSLLESEEIPELTAAEAGLINLFNEHSGAGATVTGAALMAGALHLQPQP